MSSDTNNNNGNGNGDFIAPIEEEPAHDSGNEAGTELPVTYKKSESHGNTRVGLAQRLAQSSLVWLVLWFLLNVSVTLSNKALFQFSGFTFPTTVSLFHMISSSVFSRITMTLTATPGRVLKDRSEHVTMYLFSLLFCSNILSGNIGLRFVPVSLVQCVRSTIPGITMVLSMTILGKRYTKSHFGSVTMVVVGVLIATLTTVEFHPVGFVFTVLVCFLSSLKSVMTNKFLVSKGLKLHPFDLLNKMSTFSILHLGLTSLLTGEMSRAIEWFTENGSAKFVFTLFVNAFMAFFLNVCNFFFTKLTSALTVTIVGNVKHVVTIFLSIVIFKNSVSLLNALGITTTIVGAALYSIVDYNEKQKPKEQQNM